MTEGHPAIGRIAREVRPGAAVDGVTPVEAGNRRRTAVVRFADADPVVVQRATDPETTRVEAHLLAAIRERTSVPVPTPLGSGAVDGEGWLATPLVRGDDLHRSFAGLDPADRRRIARAFGRYLAELHEAFRFDAYGPLTVCDGELAVGCAEDHTATAATGVGGGDGAGVGGGSDAGAIGDGGASGVGDEGVGGGRDGGETTGGWRSWLAAFGRAGLARLPSEFDAVRADAAALLERSDVEAAPVPRLFPWDLRPGNALVSEGRVAAVLDWEGPLAAAPALSVAKTEYLVADWYVGGDDAESLREAFRAGYRSVRACPRVRPVHRVAAVVSTAVDSRGAVTNPGYPPVSRADAVRFHLGALRTLL